MPFIFILICYMCDYSNDDLKQLLSVFSEVEYLSLSIQKTNQMHSEISDLMKTVTNKNLLFFLSLFNKVLVKEQSEYERHLKEHSTSETFEFPKIFQFASAENDEQNLANFGNTTCSNVLIFYYRREMGNPPGPKPNRRELTTKKMRVGFFSTEN